MDTLPLPPRPNLEHYRKRAKDLVKASRSQHDHAIRAWAGEWLEALAHARGVADTSFVRDSFDRAIDALAEGVRDRLGRSRAKAGGLTLADAQHLLARAHGFESWSDFAHIVEWISRGPGSVSHADFQQGGDVRAFESAADAVVAGDTSTLRSLVARHPGLVRERSSRVHRATLLHYVAANGVEDFRQKTPPNAVSIAGLLLDAGAEVDACANTYSGGRAQTTLNLLVSSAHPAEAGVQEALVETLLDHGAAVDGLEDDGSPLMTALAFGYGRAAETLALRGARIDNVVAAAALGRLELVSRFLVEGDAVQPSLVAVYWVPVSDSMTARRELALVWASAFGHGPVVELLLEHGVDPGAKDRDGMTGLHRAAGNRHLDIVRLLLRRGAPLEARNAWGGTVLDSAGWCVVNGSWFPSTYPVGQPPSSPRAEYAEVFETLIAAGADVSVMGYRTGDPRVDEVLERTSTAGDRATPEQRRR